MPRGVAFLVICLVTSGLAGCLQTSDEAGIRDLVAGEAQLSVTLTNATYEVNRTLAQDTGLTREAAAAIAGMQAPLKETFPEGRREAVLAESEYVHVSFEAPTTLDLPSYAFDNGTTFTDLYLLFNTTSDLQGHILVKGPDAGGAWGTSYDMAPLSQAAFAAVGELRPPTVPPSPPPKDNGTYQDPVMGPVPLDQDRGPFSGWVTGIQDRTTVVVRNHTQLVDLYSNLTAGMRPPQVLLGHHAGDADRFEDQLYLGAFFGATTGGCDRAAIDSATYTANGTLIVEGRWIQVNATACEAPEHWPFQVVRVKTGERGIPANVTVDVRMENVTLEAPGNTLVGFDELAPGAWGARMDRESIVITNQSAYNETWYRYLESHGPRTPAVSQPLWASFEHDTVVGIAWGPVQDWCADIGIHDVLYNGTTGAVEVQAAIYDTPGADCVDKEEPFHPVTFVRLPAVAAPVNVTFHDLRLAELPMDTLADGWSSGIEDRGVHVVTSQAAWEQLWADHRRAGDDQPFPEVDFDRATVIAAFFGAAPNGCYDVELDRFRVLGDGLAGLHGAYVKTGEACIDSESQPFRIVTVPWHHGRVKVTMADRTTDPDPRDDESPPNLSVTWTDPRNPNSTAWRLVWDVRSADWSQDGQVAILHAVDPSQEGLDFDFTLKMRPSGPGANDLTFDQELSQPGTYTFSYQESGFWAREIQRVVEVNGSGSWVAMTVDELGEGDFSVHFNLRFNGTCGGGDGCERRDGGSSWTLLRQGEYPTDETRDRRLD